MGRIVKLRGDGNFGFDPIFEPEGSAQTLAEAKPDEVSARWRAIDGLAKGNMHSKVPPIAEWDGPWQK